MNQPVQTPFAVAQTTVPIAGSAQRFPVRRIYCIGRNYAAHAIEMGSDPTREPPFFFQKPTDAIQVVLPDSVTDHPYPPLTQNYHYEVELVAALSKGGRDIAPEDALQCVYGYALGLDMTRRDLQRGMGDQKKPWEIGKSFDHAAPHRADPPRGPDGALPGRRDLAVGERRTQAAGHAEPHDLVGGRADFAAVASV